ncbi:MAG: S1 RNA-binding domain-containing protein [Myxococcales bacterium]|nr:S1 RNA-binding domain-containing protein [Myxococcales bacterium]
MTEPEHSDPTSPATDAGSPPPAQAVTADAPTSPDASPAADAAPTDGDHKEPAPAATATASDAASGDSADAASEGADEADDGGESEGEPGATGAQADGAPADGAPKKKRRRRRKKKPATGDAAQADGAAPQEGAAAEGSAEAKPKREKKEKKEPRERPAFNVGDVVFGKVLEVTEDVLFVDLSGKARALFDLRELLIVDEPDAPRPPDDDDDASATDVSASADAAASTDATAPTDATADANASATAPADATASADASADANASATAPADASATAPAPADASPDAPPPASSEVGEAVPATLASGDVPADIAAAVAGETPTAPTGETIRDKVAVVAAKPPPENPQLPRVILEPGASFVGLVHNDGGRGGLVVLTHHPRRASRAKAHVSQAAKDNTLVDGLVTGVIKGGVEVDVDGLRAFAPASCVDLRPGADLSHLVGKRLPFLVTQYAKRGRDVVLSRRAQLESEAKAAREEALKTLQIGSVVDGVVRTVVGFGAFIDVGGVEGLVPLSEMSHNRADQPRDVFKVGETCRVKILRVDEKGKIWLSRKSAIEDPWTRVAEKYAPGTKHMGKVARLQPFGAFIELESGIDGLIHTADLSIKRIEHPEELLKVGQDLEVVVASVDAKAHRIALHPAPTGDAANETPQRVQLHKNLKVVVMAVEQAGLTVRVLGATGRQARGFVSASATGTPRGTELRKLFPVGKELEAKVIEHDPRRGDLKLSIRALNDESERNAYQQYRAQVKREAKFGTFADLLAKRNDSNK